MGLEIFKEFDGSNYGIAVEGGITPTKNLDFRLRFSHEKESGNTFSLMNILKL